MLRDSNSPGVSENNVCEASSGRNNPPANTLRIIDIDIDTSPTTSPAEKENKSKLCLFDTYFYYRINDLSFLFLYSTDKSID